MSWIAECMVGVVSWWNGVPSVKRSLQRSSKPIRFGVLSAAAINGVAIFDPIDTHPDAVLVAIAASSLEKAEKQIRSYKRTSCRAYGSYEELLAQPDIDAVYIPLPNGLHFEWAIKAMKAGKHVLIEKPITSNAEQVAEISKCSQETGKVALEAFHWRFHPAAHAVKALVDSGTYGNTISVFSTMCVPSFGLSTDDIRYQYPLAGGACMDQCYIFSASCYFAGADKDSNIIVHSSSPRINATDKKIDDAITASFEVGSSARPTVLANVHADLCPPPKWGFIPRSFGPDVTIELEKARIEFTNFVIPTLWHSITITEKDADGQLYGKKRTEKHYAGGGWGSRGQAWYTTYRWQLEAFIARIQDKDWKGPWVSLDESWTVMSVIDAVYEKGELPKRGL